MKKNRRMDFLFRESLLKLWRIMRITLFLLFISVITTFAGNSYAQETRLNIQFNNETVGSIIKYIESNSDFVFLYKNEDLNVNKRVNVNLKDASIEQILSKVLEGQNVGFNIYKRQIVIHKSTSKIPAVVQQPEKTIVGKVTDTSGSPVPGVTIIAKGTSHGTITDSDGNYTLKIKPDVKTLVFSFVGMKTREVNVGDNNVINVRLEEASIGLDEVVAIGYGTVRRKDLTGSVSSVSGNTLKDIPVTSAAQAIVGRMPGVQVTTTEGSPDADIKIRIRGGGSITQDNSPLYIVDGFPVDNINDIAPTDIESIDVLKDASSTAIYGARGANGVILITTKGGSEGKGKVSYNMYYGVKKITKTLDVLNPYEYVSWQYEIAPDADYFSRYFGDFGDFGLYKQMKGTDWQDEVFGRTGTNMYHNLAFSGGSKISKYNISLTRNDEKEIMMGSGYERTNLTVKTFHKINDWLTIDFNSRLSDYYLKGAGTSSNSRLAHAVQFRPVDGLIDFVDSELDDGDFEVSSSFILNPVKQTNDDYKRYKRLTFNFNGAATIQFSKNLQYRFEYGYQYGERTNKHFYGLNTSNSLQYGEQPLASIEKTDMKSYRLANVLTYNKRDFIPGNNLTIMIGEELNYSKSESVTSSAKYFPKYIDAVSALSMMELGTADPIETSDNPAAKIASFFGRLNYDYKGKYLASVTFRADGSSKFAPGNQWGYFPSVSSAWRISDEQFMKETEQWLSNLKLRVSYGQSGNNRISDNAWRKTFSVSTGKLFIGNEDTPTAYLTPNSILSNPDLKWETTVTRNLGLDFGFFKQRLTGSLEAYKNTTKDLLISATIPSNTGYSTQWQNIGETSNKGFEIVLNGVICDQKDLKVSVSFNIGFNKNKIDKLGETKRWEQTSGWARSDGPSGDYLIEEGGKIGLMYGYETEGMYSFDDFDFNNGTYTLKEGASDNSALINAVRFWPGALKLKDQNGDKVVNTDDKVVIGDANPKHSGGFNLTAQYKMLDFSAFFNWVYGNDIYNANKLYFTSFASGRYYKNLLNTMNSENRFTYISQETGAVVSAPSELQEMNKNSTIWSPANSLVPLHSWGIEDGSFLRLNNITVGYSVPKNLLNEFRIEQLRVYFTAYNLWTWTNYSGYDPEVDTQRSTPLTPGIDWCAYPRSRSFNVGLNLTF